MGRKLQPGVDKIDEDWVKKEVKKILDRFTPTLKWDMPPAAVYGKTGRHDFIICQHGLFWTIETKAGKNPPTDNQIDYADEVAKAGGISILVNEWNLVAVEYVASYVDQHRALPPGHDFEEYRK